MKPEYFPEIFDQTESISTESYLQRLSLYDSNLSKASRIAVWSSQPLALNTALEFCETRNKELFVFRESFSEEEVQGFCNQYSIQALIGQNSDIAHFEGNSVDNSQNQGGLHLFTSGTSGKPKLVRHDWTSIKKAAAYVPERLQRETWLMTYSPTGYAGLQVYFAARQSMGRICYLGRDLSEACQHIYSQSVSIISGTPTFWRQLITAWPTNLSKPKLKQASLGGETVDQGILNSIRDVFQPDRISHIYASTEAGSVLNVSDEKAGFPASWLSQETRTNLLKIEDGRLFIRSKYGMQGYSDGSEKGDWIDSGDLVEVVNDRVLFRGRADSLINVGGSKVRPEEVEAKLNSIPHIKDSYVYSKKSPITGNIILADVISDSEMDVAEIKRKLAGDLEPYQVPQIIKFVDKIELNENGKKIRLQ